MIKKEGNADEEDEIPIAKRFVVNQIPQSEYENFIKTNTQKHMNQLYSELQWNPRLILKTKYLREQVMHETWVMAWKLFGIAILSCVAVLFFFQMIWLVYTLQIATEQL